MRQLRVYIVCFLFLWLTGVSINTILAQTAEADCSAAPVARLKAGDRAKAIAQTSKDFPGTFFKEQPNRISPVLRYLPIGTVVEVVAGPECNDGLNWYEVKLGNIKGFMAESSGRAYTIEPFSGDAPEVLSTTTLEVMQCIGFSEALPTPTYFVPTLTPDPFLTPLAPATGEAEAATEAPTDEITATGEPTEAATEAPTVPPGERFVRVVFLNESGELLVSDNGAIARAIAKFDPYPYAVDLSPDGTAALVVTYNGVYWVDVETKETIFVADGVKFGFGEGAWVSQVKWLPDMRGAALEVMKNENTVLTYEVWALPLDGTYVPYRVDAGAQHANGIYRSPKTGDVVVLSDLDITPFPRNFSESPLRLLEYISRMPEGENTFPVIIPFSWNAEGRGFYTHIPISDQAPPDDVIGGHIWYVGLDGTRRDLGKVPLGNTSGLILLDYIVPSGDGEYFIAGRGTTWTIRSQGDAKVIQTLPPGSLLFGWTPDYKGVVYRSQQGETKYLGIDGSTESPYIPTLNNMYDIRWLWDGSSLYLAQGADKKLSLNVKPLGKNPAFLGIVPTLNSFSGQTLNAKPGKANPPQKCEFDQ